MSLRSLFQQMDGDREIIKSPINYAGNKFDLIDFTLENLPHSKCFVDVFGGSGQVLLAKPETDLDVYNDLNNGLATFFKVFQNAKKLEEFKDRIRILIHSRELFEEYQKGWTQEQDDVTKAVMFYYMVQTSHISRGANFARVTAGKADIYRKIDRYVPRFGEIHNRLHKVQVENLEFSKLLRDYDSHDTVFYCDPPYWESNQYTCKMSKDQHRYLCKLIFDCEGYVALAGYSNEIYRDYPWTRIETKEVRLKTGYVGEQYSQSRLGNRTEYLFIKEFGRVS